MLHSFEWLRLAGATGAVCVWQMDVPPRWETVSYRLKNWLLDLPRLQSPDYSLTPAEQTWESLALSYFSDEQSARPAVDHLVRDAVRGGRLPRSISARDAHYVGMRLLCALDFVGMVYPPQAKTSPFPDLKNAWSEGQLIEWLLVDLWLRRHDHWLKLTAIGVYGPFGFYGIGPAAPGDPR